MFVSGQGLDRPWGKLSSSATAVWTAASLETGERTTFQKMSASSCLLLLKSKWAVMRSSFSPWCTRLVWICGCSFAECSLCCSAGYYPPHSLTVPCTCMLYCQRAFKNGLKAVAVQNPIISTMGEKNNGHIHLLGLSGKKGYGGEMGLGWTGLSWTPGGYRSLEEWCLAAPTICQASSSRGAITAIDGAPRCEAEIWVSVGNLCCCSCTLNTNTDEWIVLVHLLPAFSHPWQTKLSILCFG